MWISHLQEAAGLQAWSDFASTCHCQMQMACQGAQPFRGTLGVAGPQLRWCSPRGERSERAEARDASLRSSSKRAWVVEARVGVRLSAGKRRMSDRI